MEERQKYYTESCKEKTEEKGYGSEPINPLWTGKKCESVVQVSVLFNLVLTEMYFFPTGSGGKGQTRFVSKTIKNDSFFNFFAPPEGQ